MSTGKAQRRLARAKQIAREWVQDDMMVARDSSGYALFIYDVHQGVIDGAASVAEVTRTYRQWKVKYREMIDAGHIH